jgi:hypothetical protein
MLLVFLTLSIVAVQFFAGVLYQCVDPSKGGAAVSVHRVDCHPPLLWTNPPFMGNFDSVPAAFLVMFELATEENWPNTMYAFVDASPAGSGLAPVQDQNQLVGFFFVLCILLGSLFIKDLMIGTVVDTYNSNYAMFTGSSELTQMQKNWLDLYKQMVDTPPPLRYESPRYAICCRADVQFRKFFFWLQGHPTFENFSMLVIVFNVIALAMAYYQASNTYMFVLDWANNVFSCLFVCEMLIKWIGVGLGPYFVRGWNQFDCIVTTLGLLDFLSSYNLVSMAFLGFNPTLLRVFRLLRMLRLIRHFRTIQALIKTLLFALPAMANVGLLLFLLMFCYSILGMNMFGTVKPQYYLDSNHRNFGDFVTGFILLCACFCHYFFSSSSHPPEFVYLLSLVIQSSDDSHGPVAMVSLTCHDASILIDYLRVSQAYTFMMPTTFPHVLAR